MHQKEKDRSKNRLCKWAVWKHGKCFLIHKLNIYNENNYNINLCKIPLLTKKNTNINIKQTWFFEMGQPKGTKILILAVKYPYEPK